MPPCGISRLDSLVYTPCAAMQFILDSAHSLPYDSGWEGLP
jgi:hypothetical protein